MHRIYDENVVFDSSMTFDDDLIIAAINLRILERLHLPGKNLTILCSDGP